MAESGFCWRTSKEIGVTGVEIQIDNRDTTTQRIQQDSILLALAKTEPLDEAGKSWPCHFLSVQLGGKTKFQFPLLQYGGNHRLPQVIQVTGVNTGNMLRMVPSMELKKHWQL